MSCPERNSCAQAISTPQPGKMKNDMRIILFALLFSLLFQQAMQASPAAPIQPKPEHKDNYYLETTLGHPNFWFPRDMPIKVMIRAANNIENYQPYQTEVFKECLKRYESISLGRIKFQLVDRFPYDITCNFSHKLPPGATDSDAGWTTIATSPYHIDSANITILTRNKKWLEKEILREICMHEIGHALGMRYHSPDPHDVMYPVCSVNPQKLSIRDANTLGIIYRFRPSEAVLAKVRSYDGSDTSGKPVFLSQEQSQAYCKALEDRLKSGSIKDGTAKYRCDVVLLLDSSGNIYNYRITKRSDSVTFDQSVLSSLVTSIPLPKPPDGILSCSGSDVQRLLLAFTYSSDGKVVPAAPPAIQNADFVPCSEAAPATPLYPDDQSASHPGAPHQDDAQWVSQVRELAKSNFHPMGTGSLVVTIGIKPDGAVAHLGIKQSTANAFFEKAAIDSCILAEPYPKPPGNGDFVRELDISFD